MKENTQNFKNILEYSIFDMEFSILLFDRHVCVWKLPLYYLRVQRFQFLFKMNGLCWLDRGTHVFGP